VVNEEEASTMSAVETASEEDRRAVENFDVLIVGAGISGIGSAYHLSHQLPNRSYVVLEAQNGYGGTWRTHRYPGIRSDSDLYTFGFRFKPWTSAPIASGAEIQKYLGDVIDENSLAAHIRYDHHIESASWSSDDNRWTVVATRTDTGESVYFTANFLWMCQGYYRHNEGYTPSWPGMDTFAGLIVHPQTWPETLDYENKTVVVIGSGATAATLVPAIAEKCAHVTLLQRSPTYFLSRPNTNEIADMLRELDVSEEWIHEIARKKVLHDLRLLNQIAFDEPDFAKEALIDAVRAELPPDYDVATHFTPHYRPWQQRLAFLPDGDLLKEIAADRATMVTDEIVSFTETGILLKSGRELHADIVVTATGFHLSVLGDIAFTVDGAALDLARTVTYRGTMFTGVPNLAWVFGYFRASWTLRVDLIGDFVCRLLGHMESRGATRVVPELRSQDLDAPVLGWLDPEDFNPGYMMRSMDLLPHRLDRPEWQLSQDYWAERDELPLVDFDDGCLHFG
jgi:cation diffusion facilitator CzcD-associated flavoprotein CzcO